MPRRTSNRDRMEQLRAEADAAAKERAARPRAAPKSGPRVKAVARVRLAWSVCGPSGKEVARFAYAQEEEARADAKQRTETTGQTHFVSKAEVPVE
jgi:hypothetical protein